MTKIKFGTDGWRAIIAEDYTIENLSRVTEATAEWLKDAYTTPSVMLGYDCRFNGLLFAQRCATVFALNGVKVFLAPDFVSTPMVSLATFKRQTSAGIVITASHNPPEYSGFKIKGNYGGPATPEMIDAVERRIPEKARPYWKAGEKDPFEGLLQQKKIEYYDMEALYINHLKEAFDLKLIRGSGIKVGYDAMFGAGQNVIRKLLPEARLLHCDFNPSFLGTAPEPIEKNLGEFQALIRNTGIEFGLATDGDADRIGLFDEKGEFVDSHHILLLLLHYLVTYKKLKGKVVWTFSVTNKLQRLCDHFGLQSEVTKIGFKYICEIMLNENVIVGGEESGGIAIAGHVPERDGIFIGLTLLEYMAHSGKSLNDLIAEVYAITGPFEFGRNDLHLTEEKKNAVKKKCETDPYTSFGDLKVVKTESLDGFKFHFDADSWVMIRPSGTEPVLRVYSEGPTKARVQEILDKTVATIRQ